MANMSLKNYSKPNTSLKSKLDSTGVKNKFNDIFKDSKKAGQFLASLSSAVSSNASLASCNPNEVIVCAGIAASLDLDINPNLGFSAIIPFNKSTYENGQWVKTPHPQFQIMTKGYIQLALRTGQYQALNVTEIYADELLGVNYITGKIDFYEKGGEQRKRGDEAYIVGYCAYMKLNNGFEHYEYWPIEKIVNHATAYVPSYKYDLEKPAKERKSLWFTNFPAMAKKTVIKAMLKSWGILSTQLQQAILADDAIGERDGVFEYDVTPKPQEIEQKQTPKENQPPKTDNNFQQEMNYDDTDFSDSGLF